MKKIAFSLGCIALGLTASAVSFAQEAAAAPATTAVSPARQPAVRAYMLRTIACMMESAAAQAESPATQQSAKLFVDSFESAHKAVAALPAGDLPADFQAYIRESDEISREFVEQCRELIPADGSEISEDALREIQAIQIETQVRLAQLEEKYPDVASVMGREALKDFTDEVTEELSLKEKAAVWAEAHKAELEPKGPAALADVLRYIASELRKAADAL